MPNPAPINLKLGRLFAPGLPVFPAPVYPGQQPDPVQTTIRVTLANRVISGTRPRVRSFLRAPVAVAQKVLPLLNQIRIRTVLQAVNTSRVRATIRYQHTTFIRPAPIVSVAAQVVDKLTVRWMRIRPVKTMAVLQPWTIRGPPLVPPWFPGQPIRKLAPQPTQARRPHSKLSPPVVIGPPLVPPWLPKVKTPVVRIRPAQTKSVLRNFIPAAAASTFVATPIRVRLVTQPRRPVHSFLRAPVVVALAAVPTQDQQTIRRTLAGSQRPTTRAFFTRTQVAAAASTPPSLQQQTIRRNLVTIRPRPQTLAYVAGPVVVNIIDPTLEQQTIRVKKAPQARQYRVTRSTLRPPTTTTAASTFRASPIRVTLAKPAKPKARSLYTIARVIAAQALPLENQRKIRVKLAAAGRLFRSRPIFKLGPPQVIASANPCPVLTPIGPGVLTLGGVTAGTLTLAGVTTGTLTLTAISAGVAVLCSETLACSSTLACSDSGYITAITAGGLTLTPITPC